MNNIYVTEPPPNGKVLLQTSKGDIEIELWAKEAPKAVRNFITLIMEGYYDGQIWHRIVPGFCIQTGDPTGTGAGGESCYGEPFANEPHQRLRFNRRGLVAMANSGEPDSNESQFFITLDQTPELQGKYTIFGRVSGPTIYNVTSLSEVELSKTEPDRPIYPPKLISIQILDNPFEDIVPRITKEEKKAQQRAKRQALESREKERDRKKVKKNVGLLSFGEAEEVQGGFEGGKGREEKKGISSHDLLKDDRKLKKESIGSRETEFLREEKGGDEGRSNFNDREEKREKGKEKEKGQKKTSQWKEPRDSDLSTIRSSNSKSKKQSSESASKIQSLEDSIRGLSSSSHDVKETDDEKKSKEKKINKGRELLQQARLYYASSSGSSSKSTASSRNKESEAMKALERFQNSLREAKGKGKEVEEESRNGNGSGKERKWKEVEDDEEIPPEDREYGAGDDDGDDDDWRSHRLDGGGIPISTKQDQFQLSDYEVLDPRNSSSTAAASLGFGSASDQKSAASEARRKGGRRGRDWVDHEDRKYERGKGKGDSNGNGNGTGRKEGGLDYRRDSRGGDRRRDIEDDKPEWGRRR